MKRLLFLVLFTLALALLPIMAFRGDLWLSSDFLHQEISFILETKRMLATGAPWWSWNTYLGSDFIGAYAFYTLTSPFVWINCLLPESLLEVGVAITLVLKFLCLALLSWLYLRKMGVSRDNSCLGSFLFTFSSFNIVSLYYYHFYEPIIAFLLLLITIERLLRREKWGMTCVALASFVVTFVNFYFAIGTFIAVLIYVIFRGFSSEIDFSFKTAVKGVGAVLVGIVMCAFMLMPVYFTMLDTTRADAQSIFDERVLQNLLERLRTLFMPKVVEGTTVFVPGGSGSLSNEACIAVFGLSLAAIYAWRCRNWLTGLLITFLVLYLTPLNGIFTLFTNPFYTRWAYALTLIIVLCSMKVLDEGSYVKRGVLSYSILASIVVLAFVANVLVNSGSSFPGTRFILLIVLFLAGIVLLLLWGYGKISMRWLKIGIVGCVVVQMWLFLLNLATINNGIDSQRYKNYVHDIEKGTSIGVDSRVDFRGHASDFLSFNLGLLRNHASVQGYHSVINRDVNNFMQLYTRYFWATNKLRANVHQDELDALLSVKDIYDIDSVGNVTRRENKYYIPMGFTYDKYMLESDFSKMREDTTINLPLMMLAAVVISGSDDCMDGLDYHESLDLDSLVAKRKECTATSFKGDSRGFTAMVDLPSTKMVFFSVPYSRGFTARIDGKESRIYKANLCMMALKVPEGKHNIAVDYFPPGLITGSWISLVGLLLLMLIVWSEWKKKRRSR